MKNEEDKFSWSGLFLVTACSCFLFSLAVKIMEGTFSSLLLILGAATGVLGLLSLGIKLVDRRFVKKRSDNRFIS